MYCTLATGFPAAAQGWTDLCGTSPESPLTLGQGQGQGTEWGRLLAQQIRPWRGALRTGYSLHPGARVRGLLGTTSSSLPPILWCLAISQCVLCLRCLPECCVMAGASWLLLSEVGSCLLCPWCLSICSQHRKCEYSHNLIQLRPDPSSPEDPLIPSPWLWATAPCTEDMAGGVCCKRVPPPSCLTSPRMVKPCPLHPLA